MFSLGGFEFVIVPDNNQKVAFQENYLRPIPI